ncbi:MAG TPA: helix-turn-helix transcriptional regulator [Acidimicrobiales bacterium]|nr:helix-turn-helix transcriptional regulator [Acidimicrobiales bacterium]
MANPPELTTTSYAILGLLATRSWTTYELARQVGRAMGEFWPRAESKLYEEPKKLVARGLAKASSERVGRRPRTVYSITPAGRRALRTWLPEAGAGPVLEFEALVKVFFAEHGSRDDLLATLERVREWAEVRAAAGVALCREYLEGEGPFPERLPWLILTGKFLDEFDAAVLRWVEWAEAQVREWPEDVRAAAPDWDTLAGMAARNEAVVRRARERSRAL